MSTVSREWNISGVLVKRRSRVFGGVWSLPSVGVDDLVHVQVVCEL